MSRKLKWVSLVLVFGFFLTSAASAKLIGYWPLDGDATDKVGGYDGTLEGDVTFGDGKLESAASFNGSNTVVNCGDVPIGEALTVAFWVNPGNLAPNYRGFVSKWTADNEQRTFWVGQHATAGRYCRCRIRQRHWKYL